MKSYNLIIPVTGAIQLNICAEDTSEALNILMNKKPDLETLPNGHLDMEISKIIVIETELNEYN